MDDALDRPIEKVTEDRLARQDFVKRIIGALVGSNGHATGAILGLTGPWGSGKSSILNLVVEIIENAYPSIVLVPFNPWLISSRDDLIEAFFKDVVAALQKKGRRSQQTQQAEKLKGLAQKIFDYGKRIAPAANFIAPGAGTLAGAGLEALAHAVSGEDTLHEKRAQFARELDESETDLVVLIDEIDRLDDSEVAVLAQLVRAVADFRHISYLLAYDPDRVAEALGKGNAARGRAYLEKIVQLEIPLPHILPQQIRHIIEARFRELVASPDDHRERLSEILNLLVPSSVSTLRDAKRLLGVFELLYRLLHFEVDEVDLLGWAAILTKYPYVEQVLRRRQEQIIGPEKRLFGEELLDWMLRGWYPTAVDLEMTYEPDHGELRLARGEEQLASGPSAQPLQKLLEFMFKGPWENRARHYFN
jgi:predicted KAP-like P-loop ATPase